MERGNVNITSRPALAEYWKGEDCPLPPVLRWPRARQSMCLRWEDVNLPETSATAVAEPRGSRGHGRATNSICSSGDSDRQAQTLSAAFLELIALEHTFAAKGRESAGRKRRPDALWRGGGQPHCQTQGVGAHCGESLHAGPGSREEMHRPAPRSDALHPRHSRCWPRTLARYKYHFYEHQCRGRCMGVGLVMRRCAQGIKPLPPPPRAGVDSSEMSCTPSPAQHPLLGNPSHTSRCWTNNLQSHIKQQNQDSHSVISRRNLTCLHPIFSFTVKWKQKQPNKKAWGGPVPCRDFK